MDQFEQDLQRRLARRDPSADFTQRVMGRVRQEPGSSAPARAESPRVRAWSRWRSGWRWAIPAAAAASLAVGVISYQRDAREERRLAEIEAARQAEAQLVETLFLAGEKIQFARARMGGDSQGSGAAGGE